MELRTCANPVSCAVLSQPSEQWTSTATPLCSSSTTKAALFIIYGMVFLTFNIDPHRPMVGGGKTSSLELKTDTRNIQTKPPQKRVNIYIYIYIIHIYIYYRVGTARQGGAGLLRISHARKAAKKQRCQEVACDVCVRTIRYPNEKKALPV